MNPRHALIDTPLGHVTLVAEGDALTGLYFAGQAHLPDAATFGPRVAADDDPVLARARTQLDAYFDGGRHTLDLPTRTNGDEFSERVWALLTQIPYGETITYGALAERLGDKNLAQRVGQAVGHNPIGIVIPCHRVVGADGALTGYAGGLHRKRALLDLEEPAEVAAARLF